MRLGRESKIPIGLEKGYTTKCAERYASDEAGEWIPDPHMEALVENLEEGGSIGWVPPEGIMVVDCDNSQAVAFVDARRDKTTPIQKRRSHKQHFYFSYDPQEFHVYTRNGIKIEIGSDQPTMIDLKTCGFVGAKKGGGYAVVPPSLHDTDADHPYEWKRKLPKDRSKIPELPLDLRNAFAPFLNKGKKVDRSGASRHDKVLRFQQRLVIEAREDSEEVHEEIVGQTRDLIKELYSDEPARLAQWESPRLCRGGLHSLTVPEIDETPSREPLKASRERVNCRTTERYSTQSGSVNITSSSSRSIVGRCSTGSCESIWARSSEGSHDRRSARLRKVI